MIKGILLLLSMIAQDIDMSIFFIKKNKDEALEMFKHFKIRLKINLAKRSRS